MERRNFIKLGAAAAAVSAFDLSCFNNLHAKTNKTPASIDGELAAIMGEDPALMLERSIEELGGIGKYIKPGQRIVIKPNIGWAKTPEMAADTNPLVVGRLTKLCMDHGAKEVIVFDHTCHDWVKSYDLSGIKKEVEYNGGKMVPGNDNSYYVDVDLPKGKNLKKTKIHKALLECDEWFNVPILKHHGGAKMSLSMKNYMGIIQDRRFFHKNGLHQCIADVCTWEKKPALNIIDGFRTLTQNGPQGKTEADVSQTRVLFASSDPVAVDTSAIKFFAQVKPVKLEDVEHIALGEKHGLGTMDLSRKNIKRVKI